MGCGRSESANLARSAHKRTRSVGQVACLLPGWPRSCQRERRRHRSFVGCREPGTDQAFRYSLGVALRWRKGDFTQPGNRHPRRRLRRSHRPALGYFHPSPPYPPDTAHRSEIGNTLGNIQPGWPPARHGELRLDGPAVERGRPRAAGTAGQTTRRPCWRDQRTRFLT